MVEFSEHCGVGANGAWLSHRWVERGRPRIGTSSRYRYIAQITQDEATSGGCFCAEHAEDGGLKRVDL